MTKTQFTPGKLYLIVGSILGITLLFPFASYLLVSTPHDTLEADRERNRWKVHFELDEANKKLAENSGWVDEKAGIVRIPLARALELELPVLAASKPRPGAPLVAPAPPSAAAPTTQPAPGAAAPANGTQPTPTPPNPGSASSTGAPSAGNPKPATTKPAPAPAKP